MTDHPTEDAFVPGVFPPVASAKCLGPIVLGLPAKPDYLEAIAAQGSEQSEVFDEVFERVAEGGGVYTTKGSRPVDPPPSWKAGGICAEAARLVAGDRETTHGSKKQNFTNVGTMFTAILQVAGVLAPGKQVDAHLAATLCEGLKIARRFTGTVNPDDYVDSAGYAGVAGECILT